MISKAKRSGLIITNYVGGSGTTHNETLMGEVARGGAGAKGEVGMGKEVRQ
jgi:hypothetical protein